MTLEPSGSESLGAQRPRLAAQRYVVIEQIGHGAMGVVLRAYDARLHREVALKRVRPAELSVAAQAELLCEAQAMAKLSHPNVVAVYDVEFDGDESLIAMEYVRGATLGAWLARFEARERPWREVVRMFVVAGRGLAAAHAAGILHRDFKPANVLVGDDGRVCVGDFGLALARASSDDVTLATSGGTPRYMAPEQHFDEALTPAADQYAFCVALWEGLTGEPPFAKAESPELGARKLQGAPPWPRHVRVPAAIRDALVRGLSPAPQKRFASMSALLGVLDDASHPGGRGLRLLGGALVVGGCIAMAWSAHRQQAATQCSGATAALEPVWNEQRRAAVHAAFSNSGVPYGADTARMLDDELDRYASTWIASHVQACEATTVRGEQPAEIMDLRMTCLHQARVGLRAVVDILARADGEVVENAYEVVGGLPELQRCSDVEALRSELPPPAPSEREAVEAVRAQLAEVKALHDAGKVMEASARMGPVATRAQTIAYAPLRSEVMLMLGSTSMDSGDLATGERHLKSSLRSALALGQWRLAANAVAALISTMGLERASEAMSYAVTGVGLLPHADASTEVSLRMKLALAMDALGHFTASETEYRAALEVGETAWGASTPKLALVRATFAGSLAMQGRYAEAEQEVRAQLRLQEDAFAPDHPLVPFAHYLLGMLLMHQGNYVEAEAEARVALASYEKTFGSTHPLALKVRGGLADVLTRQERAEEAAAEYRSVLEGLRQQADQSPAATCVIKLGLGEALTALGRHDEANVQLHEGIGLAERIHGPSHPRTARGRALLAASLLRQEHLHEAEDQVRTAIEIYERAAPSHADRAVAHQTLAEVLQARGRPREARAEAHTALELTQSTLGTKHPRYTLVEAFLASLPEVDSHPGVLP